MHAAFHSLFALSANFRPVSHAATRRGSSESSDGKHWGSNRVALCSQSIRPFLMLSNKPQRSDLRFPKSSPLRFGPRLREIAPVRGRDAVSRNLGAGHGSHCLDPDSEFSSDLLVEFLSIIYYCFLIGSFSRECCWGKLLQSIREMRARFHTINSGLSEKEPLFPQSRSHGQSGNASIFMPI